MGGDSLRQTCLLTAHNCTLLLENACAHKTLMIRAVGLFECVQHTQYAHITFTNPGTLTNPNTHLLICTAVVDDNVGHRSHTRLADCLVKLDELLLVAILGVQVVQLALGMCTSIDQQQPVSGVKIVS